MNSIKMDLQDEKQFSNWKEFRIYDRINFRLNQEILLRDDEIKRLKKRLDMLNYYKQKNNNSSYITNVKNFHDDNILMEKIESLKNEVYRETSKAEMKLTNLSIKHSQKISQMNNRFEEEIQSLKQTLYDKTHLNDGKFQLIDDDSAQVEQFLQSLQSIIHLKNYKHYKKDNYHENDNDKNFEVYEDKESISMDGKIYSSSKEFDMHLYNEEIQDNEQRIKQIRQLIKKYQSNSNYKSMINKSNSISHDANNYNTEISLNDSQSEFNNSSSFIVDKSKPSHVQAKIQKLLNEHRKQVEILTNKIKKEKKKSLFIQKKIEMATNQSFLTDAEIAETIKVKEKIKKRKEKKNSLKITIESLSEMSIQQREEVLKRLKTENITLKREIARVDSVAYGRTGKYQYWKKLDDEALFKCTMLYFQ